MSSTYSPDRFVPLSTPHSLHRLPETEGVDSNMVAYTESDGRRTGIFGVRSTGAVQPSHGDGGTSGHPPITPPHRLPEMGGVGCGFYVSPAPVGMKRRLDPGACH